MLMQGFCGIMQKAAQIRADIVSLQAWVVYQANKLNQQNKMGFQNETIY